MLDELFSQVAMFLAKLGIGVVVGGLAWGLCKLTWRWCR